MTKQDYVILVSPSEPRGCLGLNSDEDDAGQSALPPRTGDIASALHFGKFSDARRAVREAAKRYPSYSFRIDVAPAAQREGGAA
ncbi:hypothetical protein [Cupriavidus malaysiensis]|uniref:hypothetical protein n=1 Tax=Cupriavidus malaysiensis TaxID=367825 RepID=UPI0012FF70E7|nr:hypothetical protein [Cupriavidus malaysiensis]